MKHEEGNRPGGSREAEADVAKEGDAPGNSVTAADITFFLKYLQPLRGVALGLLATTVLLAALRALIPLNSKIFTDYIVPGTGPGAALAVLEDYHLGIFAGPATAIVSSMPALVLAMVVLGALMGVCTLASGYFTALFRERYAYHLQTDLVEHVLRFPAAYFRSHPTGYIMARITGDTDSVEYVFSQFLPQIVANILFILFSVAVLVRLSVELTVVVLLAIPLFVVANALFTKRIRRLTRTEREGKAFFMRDIQEMLVGIDRYGKGLRGGGTRG
ncbi:MAG: ABC transporter ATP-binding protein [Methanomicrobiaceae archaeon]|nr:ABC transporter ATP-binding protein [Methanomicrobiaceae archaeon]